MKIFTDVTALQGIIATCFSIGSDAPKVLESYLISDLDFTSELALLYTKTVLAEIKESSAQQFKLNSEKLLGNWSRSDGYQSQVNYMKSSISSWYFERNLKYQFMRNTNEFITNPFGGGYTKSSQQKENGYWAASNKNSDTFELILMPDNKKAYVMSISFDEAYSNMCKISSDKYSRM